jgi:hypothetical protein
MRRDNENRERILYHIQQSNCLLATRVTLNEVIFYGLLIPRAM